MNSAELAGDLVDTALVASAIDPAAPGQDGHTHESVCLNCGTALTGAFCHQCGQAAHVHRTLGAFFHDLLHGVFHFEGRVWHTLPLLAWRPGELTRRYIEGQRARFVSPLALFLFCVFLMFAVIHQTDSTPQTLRPTVAGQVTKGLAGIDAQIAQLQAQRAAKLKAGDDTDDIDEQISALRSSEALIRTGHAPGPISATGDLGLNVFKTLIEDVKDNPELVLFKVETHAYKYSWLLIPISVPFVWLLFPFSRRFAVYDHTVFVTFSLSFMTLLAVVAMLATTAGLDWLTGLLVFVPPVHMYRQLRGAYGCSRGGALLRTFALLLFSTIALGIFAAIIVGSSTD